MLEEELCAALQYGAHYYTSKEVGFIRQDITEQVQAGHIIISPLAAVRGLPTLWIPPVAVIPQVGQSPHLVFYFTWISLNEATAP